MTSKELMQSYLEDDPKFRERRNKDRGIVNLLMKRYGSLMYAIEKGVITKETVTAMVQDYATMDRACRQALEKYQSLRGKDYDEKDKLEVSAMKNLGYNVPQMVGEAEAVGKEVQTTLI